MTDQDDNSKRRKLLVRHLVMAGVFFVSITIMFIYVLSNI